MATDKKTPEAEAPEVKNAEVEQAAVQKTAKEPSKTAWLDVIGQNIHDTAKENRIMVNVHLKDPETGEKSHGNIFAFKNQLVEPHSAEKFNETAKDPAKRYVLALHKDSPVEVSFKQPDNTYQSKTMTGSELVKQASAYQADVAASRQAAREAKASAKQDEKPVEKTAEKSVEKAAEQPAAKAKESTQMWLHVTGAQVHKLEGENRVRINVGLKDPETGEKSKANMFRAASSVVEFENDKAHNAVATKDSDKHYGIPLKKDASVELSFRKEDGSFETKKMLGEDVVKQNNAYRADLNAERQAAREAKAVEAPAAEVAAPAKADRGAQAAARLGVEEVAEAPDMQAGN